MAPTGLNMTYKVQFKNWNHFNNAMRHRAANMGPWFDVYAQVFYLAEETHFESVGVFGGVGDLWAVQYGPKYAKWKLETVGHLKKEYLGGNLFRSLTSANSDSVRIETKSLPSPGSGLLATQSIEMGTRVPYAALQQYGSRALGLEGAGKRKNRHVPPRPPVLEQLPDGLLNALNQSVVEYLVNGSLFIPRF